MLLSITNTTRHTLEAIVIISLYVMIPPWPPLHKCQNEQEEYDEDIQALVRMHAMSEEEEEKDYEPKEDSWQISCLVSTDTFDAGSDTGRIQTGRMKIT